MSTVFLFISAVALFVATVLSWGSGSFIGQGAVSWAIAGVFALVLAFVFGAGLGTFIKRGGSGSDK
jgi:hypothetical protein